MTSRSGSRDTADQKAIDEIRGTRPSPAILAAAIPTATCPMLAMFSKRETKERERGRGREREGEGERGREREEGHDRSRQRISKTEQRSQRS
jgi:hypothetical protein